MNLLIGVIVACMPIDNYVKLLEKETKCTLIVTSGHRTPEHNKKVGGSKNSYHLYDRARDLVPKDKKCISFKKLANIACKMGMSVIQYDNHIHIDNRSNKICLDWSNGKKYTKNSLLYR